MYQRRAQRGFTLIEIMMVVALIAVLAAIAIPNFVSQTAKTKGDAEINAMFAELRLGQERYRAENGAYLATTAAETSLYPATPSVNERDMLVALPTEWRTLKYRGAERARCSYGVIVGPGGGGTIGARATSFGFTTPTVDWYYILARCDLDNNSSVDSFYFTDSNNPTIRKQNPGR
jgi:prepilin-type N-terminal cleavage/methylation domain-containing protein